MGQCFSIAKEIIQTSPPTNTKTIPHSQYYNLLKATFPETAHIELSDRYYTIYSKEDLERFLTYDFTNFKSGEKELFDCDDFAKVLMGRERLWIKQKDGPKGGSTFGLVHGDIRTSEEDTNPRYHALNFVVLLADNSNNKEENIIRSKEENKEGNIPGSKEEEETVSIEELEVWLIEPQNDKIFKMTSNSNIWFVFS